MNNLPKKIFYSVILAVYITINLLSAFHFHPLKFSARDYSVVDNSGGSSTSDPFMDADSNCQLLQFAQLSYLESHTGAITGTFNFTEVYFIDTTEIRFTAFEGWSGNLRAPPALS